MAVVLTISICINVFQAVIFWLYTAGVRARFKELEKECDDALERIMKK